MPLPAPGQSCGERIFTGSQFTFTEAGRDGQTR
jgi:hypothetical protein